MYHRISKQIGCPKVGKDPVVVYGKQGFRGLNDCIPVVVTIAGRVLFFCVGAVGPNRGHGRACTLSDGSICLSSSAFQ